MVEQSKHGPVQRIAASIRREREAAGLSLSELAKKADVAKSTLSQLEAGTGNPSVETLWSLATALAIPFSRLMDPPRAVVQVIRAGEGVVAASEQSNYVATLLASSPPRARRDIYRIVFQPGEPRKSAPHAVGTIEHLVLMAGHARVGPVDHPIELRPGDYASYPGDVAHIYEALADETSAVIIMEMS